MNNLIDIKHAKNLVRMKDAADVIAFEKAIEGLLENKNPEVLSLLFQLFDDKCPYQEVMYGLVHAVESFPKDEYLNYFIENFHFMISHNPLWTDTLTNRILNDQSYSQEFIKKASMIDKSDFIKLMNVMEKESPHHLQMLKTIYTNIFKHD